MSGRAADTCPTLFCRLSTTNFRRTSPAGTPHPLAGQPSRFSPAHFYLSTRESPFFPVSYARTFSARGVSSSQSPLPPRLSFLVPSYPPPPVNLSQFREGQPLPRGNLVAGRGKARLAMTYWEQQGAQRIYAALRAHEELQREVYWRMYPGKGLYPLRAKIEREIECLCEAALVVIRFLCQVASRFVNIPWGDAQEWRSISEVHSDECIPFIVQCQHNAEVVRKYFALGQEHFRSLMNRFPDRNSAFTTLLKHFNDSATCFERLASAWAVEEEAFVSRDLRRRAQEKADRSTWNCLQWRAEGFRSGIKASLEMRVYLIQGLAKYLHVTRSRGALSGADYVDFFDRLQRFLPPGMTAQPRSDLCNR
ncbi:hypothetical protein JCM10207_004050 [Rhodosporidiobolus poonsookiae]